MATVLKLNQFPHRCVGFCSFHSLFLPPAHWFFFRCRMQWSITESQLGYLQHHSEEKWAHRVDIAATLLADVVHQNHSGQKLQGSYGAGYLGD